MPTTKKSVLRLEDQDDGIFPDRCVLTGEPTETAVYVWAIESSKSAWIVGALGSAGVAVAKLLGKQVRRFGLPIGEQPWATWKRRTSLCAVMTSAGCGVVLAGVFRSSVGLIVLGVLIAAASLPLRLRAQHNYWVSAELRPASGHILISPTHPAFDKQARELFRRAL